MKNSFSDSIAQIKGIAILLVVLGHLTSPLGPAIFSFHIPLFFFLGGIFIKADEAVPAFLRKNFTRLILPYLLCGSVAILMTALKNVWLHRPVESAVDSIAGLLIWMDHLHLQNYGYVLWFLPALFWARLFCVLLLKYVKINEIVLLILLVAGSYVFSFSPSPSTSIELPFCLDEAIVAMPWVYFGTLFYRYREKCLNLPAWVVASMLLALLVILELDWMPLIDLADKRIDNILITLPYTFSVIFLIIWCTYHIKLRMQGAPWKLTQWLSTLGWQTMLIYVVHVYTNTAAHLLTIHFLGGYWVVTYLLSVAMLIALVHFKLRHRDQLLFHYL